MDNNRAVQGGVSLSRATGRGTACWEPVGTCGQVRLQSSEKSTGSQDQSFHCNLSSLRHDTVSINLVQGDAAGQGILKRPSTSSGGVLCFNPPPDQHVLPRCTWRAGGACTVKSSVSTLADMRLTEPTVCCAAPAEATPAGQAHWRAGGGDLSSSILDTLKPMILQLVKEAVAQALKELIPGASAPAAGPPADSSVNPRKKKGKGQGPRHPVRLRKPRLQRPTAKARNRARHRVQASRMVAVAAGDAQGWTTVRRKKDGGTFALDAADWDAPLLTIDGLADALDQLGDGETLKGVVLCTAAQVGIASAMAKGSSKSCSLSLVVLKKDGTDTIPG